MSSDLRIKKLRGSGGYVIAALTDEQQSKASIGGPDLFLAPLCRMDTEKISKYLCNMCDKEYEGAPKIQYENPNEEVAPGLILVEKGRYVCNPCGTTIAEYREFKKEDEAEETAQQMPTEEPVTPSTDTVMPQPPVQQPHIPAETPPPSPLAARQPTEEAPPSPLAARQPTEEAPPSPLAARQPTEEAPPHQMQPTEEPPPAASRQPTEADATESAPVSAIDGRAVYDENAVKIGTVKQVGIDTTNTMVLVIAQNDGTESIIPWDKIKKIGEIVMLGDPAIQNVKEEPQDIPGKCKKCLFENKEGSKFCEQCGAKM